LGSNLLLFRLFIPRDLSWPIHHCLCARSGRQIRLESTMQTKARTTRIRPVWIAGFAFAILSVLAFVWSRNKTQGPIANETTNSTALARKDSKPDKLALKQLVEKHLARAESEVQSLEGQGHKAIEVLFSNAHENVPSYSESILGWKSKWNLILDKLPGNDQDRHEQFLKQQFEQKIFSPEQLEAAVKQAVRERLVQVRDIENQMLIGLRADIEGLPDLEQLDGQSANEFESRLQSALVQASEVVSKDLSSTIESQMVSLVAGEVMAQVAIRLSVSAGILSTGAASSWATLGIGLVAGVVIDQIVTRIWDWWSEPEAELSFQISNQLNLVHDLICKGDSDSEGLNGRFNKWNAQRSQIRRETILQIFFPEVKENANSTKHL